VRTFLRVCTPRFPSVKVLDGLRERVTCQLRRCTISPSAAVTATTSRIDGVGSSQHPAEFRAKCHLVSRSRRAESLVGLGSARQWGRSALFPTPTSPVPLHNLTTRGHGAGATAYLECDTHHSRKVRQGTQQSKPFGATCVAKSARPMKGLRLGIRITPGCGQRRMRHVAVRPLFRVRNRVAGESMIVLTTESLQQTPITHRSQHLDSNDPGHRHVAAIGTTKQDDLAATEEMFAGPLFPSQAQWYSAQHSRDDASQLRPVG